MERTSRAGAAAEWSFGSQATKATRARERTRGEGGVPSHGAALPAFCSLGASAQALRLRLVGDRDEPAWGAQAHVLWPASAPPGRGPVRPAASPPSARSSRETSSPQPAARGQTRPKAQDPRGREGRRKEVASPRQGILNYRLKASKTVHHIFHVSAGGRDKRKQNACGWGGREAPSHLLFFSFFLLSVQM